MNHAQRAADLRPVTPAARRRATLPLELHPPGTSTGKFARATQPRQVAPPRAKRAYRAVSSAPGSTRRELVQPRGGRRFWRERASLTSPVHPKRCTWTTLTLESFVDDALRDRGQRADALHGRGRRAARPEVGRLHESIRERPGWSSAERSGWSSAERSGWSSAERRAGLARDVVDTVRLKSARPLRSPPSRKREHGPARPRCGDHADRAMASLPGHLEPEHVETLRTWFTGTWLLLRSRHRAIAQVCLQNFLCDPTLASWT